MKVANGPLDNCNSVTCIQDFIDGGNGRLTWEVLLEAHISIPGSQGLLDPIQSEDIRTIYLVISLDCSIDLIHPKTQLDSPFYINFDVQENETALRDRLTLPDFEWSNTEANLFSDQLCDVYIGL